MSNRIRKRLLSLLLAVTMLCGSIPLGVLAEEASAAATETTEVTEITEATDPTEAPEATEETEAPDPTEAPEATEETQATEPTDAPEATEEPQAPEPTDAPEVTEGTEATEPTDVPEATEEAEAAEHTDSPEEALPGKTIPLGDFAVAAVGTKALSASTVQLSQKTLIAVPHPGAALTVFVRDGYQACVYSGNNSNSINQNSGWLGSDGDGTSLYCYTLPADSIYMRLSLRRTDGAAMEGADLSRSGLAVSYECGSDVVAYNATAASVLQQTPHPVLIHISDIHGDVIRAQRAAQFADAVGADALLASGDLTAYDPDDWGGALFEAVGTYPNVNFLYGVGNHDAKGFSGAAYQETIYNGYFRNNPSTPNGETYFYRDVPGQKLRLISVNQQEGSATNSRGGTCYSQAQVDWLVEALGTTPAGYGVVMMYHSPEAAITGTEDPAYSGFFQIGNRYDTPTNSTSGYTGTLLMDLVDAFMLRESYTRSYSEKDGTSPVTVNADFTQVAQGAEFIAHLTGHVHSDSITYLPGTTCKQLLLGVTCTTSMYGADGGYYGLADYSDLVREADTANQDAFNAYIIDRESKTVRVLRIGAKQTVSGQLRTEMTIPYSAPFQAGDYLFDTQGLRKLDLSDVEWVNYGIQEYGAEPTYKPGLRYSTNAVLDVPYEGVTFYIKINAPYELGIRSGETDTTMTTNYYWLNNKQLVSGDKDRGFVYTLPAGHEKFILSIANVKRNASGNVVTAENPIDELEWKVAGLEIWYSPEPAQGSAYLFDTRDKTKLDLSDVEWVNYGIQEYGAEPTYKPGLRYSTNAVLDVPYEGVTFYIKINAPYELGIRSGETDTTMTTNYYWLNNKQLVSGNQDRGFVYTLPVGHEKFILSFAHVKRDASGNLVTAENPIGEPELQAAGLEIWYKPLEEPLTGKTISILGDSISTFAGVSNSTSYNSTIGSNAVYYSGSNYGIRREDTWWQQAIDALDLKLLVNNSWSGSCILHTRSGTVGAYVDRCLQLHNDATGEEPDIIAVFMGTNDFSYYQGALGTANIDYAALIRDNGDGSFTYAEPVTSCEAYAIMLHKLTKRYPEAEIYCMTLLPRREPTYSGAAVPQPTAFNAELEKIIAHFGAKLVDLENCGIGCAPEAFDPYMADKRVHPNAAGMDAMTLALIDALTRTADSAFTVTYDLKNVTAEGSGGIVLRGDSYSAVLRPTGGMELGTVTVTMGGLPVKEGIDGGKIHIPNVTGDLVITANAVIDDTPDDYRWENRGSELVCTLGDNALTKKAGTVQNSILNNAYFQLEKPVVLRHSLPWAVEWRASGSSWSGMLFSAEESSSAAGNSFLFKTTSGTGFLGFGERANNQFENYGVPLGSLGVDTNEVHTYRIENRVAGDGSNMAYLLVDGVEYGSMDRFFIGGNSDQGENLPWLSGRDLCFCYVGASGHTLNNCALEYLAVWEDGHTHSYEETVTTPTCLEKGHTTHICTVCGDSYTDSYVEALGHCWQDDSAIVKECTICGHAEGGYRIDVEAEEVWIDGEKQWIYQTSSGSHILLERTDAKIMTVYSYSDLTDAQYPTGMQVWRLDFENGGYTATYLSEFEDLLQYAGSSIRVAGVKGIRMITGIDKALRAALMNGSLRYTLVEYGTVVIWSAAADSAPVLGKGSAMHNFAYKRGVADPIFADTGETIQYTNVLVGFTDDQLAEDLILRPYMILEDSSGEQLTIYGGCVQRSIGYVARQNQNTFPEGSNSDTYIEDIISKVYG